MKFILVFLISISSVFAADITCLQTEGEETQGMVVWADIRGNFEINSNQEVTFSEITFKYVIGEGDDYIWSRGMQSAESLANLINYNPRVYKDHMKFTQIINGDYQSEYRGFGKLDLIIPTEVLLSQKRSLFTSYLIMTYMDDHFGGTISLNCEIN